MASSKIKGITIEIDGDTTKLGKAIDSAEKSSKNLQSELKGVNSLLKLDPSNVELLRQKQDLLTKSISSTEDKLKTLKSAQVQVQDQFDKGKITEEQFRDFQREIVFTEQKLSSLKDESKNFGSVIEQQVSIASKKVQELGTKFDEVGQKAGGISTVAAGGLALATTSAASLEGAVNRVIVATGESTEKTEEFKEILTNIHDNNYGADYNDIASKMALVKQNLGDISNTDLQTITENAYFLEDAFGMDFQESIRGINGLMTNMGVDAQTAFDLMVVGAQNGLNKSNELGDNIAEYSQLWGQAGFSAEEMFTILQNGLDSGAYNLDKVNDLVKEMGISLTDGRVEKNLSSFSKNTQDLFKEWEKGGASQAEVIKSMINDLDNMENEQEALTLAGTIWSALGEDNAMSVITSLNKANNAYQNTSGAIDQATTQMYSGTGAKAEEAMKKIQTAFATIGDAVLPVITPVIEKVAELATKFSNLNPTIQKIILIIGAIVAAFAPVVIVIGKVISAIGVIMPVIAKIGGILSKAPIILGAIKTAIMTIVGTLGLPVTIILGIIAAIVLLWNKCEWFRNLVYALIDGLKKVFVTVVEWFKTSVIDPIVSFFISLWENIVAIFTPIVEWFSQLFASIWETIKSVLDVIVGLFKGSILLIQAVWGVIVEWFVTNVIEPLKKVFTPVIEFFKTIFLNAWNGIKIIWSAVTSFFNGIWNGIKAVFNVVGGWFKNIFTNAWNNIKTAFTPVTTFFSGIWNSIKKTFSNVTDWFKNTFSKAWNAVKNVFSSGGKIFDGIKDGIASTFKTVVNGIIKGINKVISVPFNAINGVLNKIRNVSVAGIEPFKGFIKKNALSIPQIPTLAVGTNKVAEEGLAYLHKNEAVVPEKYNPAVNDDVMKETMMDVLSGFTNTKVQNGGTGSIGELTKLLKQYMPEILENMKTDIVLDDRTLVGKIAPKIDKELGVIAGNKNRGW